MSVRSRPDVPAALVARVFDAGQASRWGVSRDEFAATVLASVQHAFAGRVPAEADIERYVRGLHLEDLMLASACALGRERAWEHFIREHRPALRRAADAIDPNGSARDLADALYAELFGLQERDGVRRSLFRYFHGRSSLATWLRAVLAQRYVDQVRSGKRLTPLPDDDEGVLGAQGSDPGRPPLGPDGLRAVERVRPALAGAIAALAPRDRLRLGCYYAQDLTLAAIGRLLGEHEATVSRHLARTRRLIRVAVERTLRADHGLDGPAIAECLEAVMNDPGRLDMTELMGSSASAAGGKTDGQDRSR